ncbi:MAG: ArsS family sensor histidine kinase [Candidatus Marinarcus sp.]|uniref:ArsS family sensor histidine kinase n=1 Tax=Candidatus Marinarcus sp. TaxID=3100987 RepID=UPI003B00B079
MKNVSISTFINVIFFVAFCAITLAFVFFINIDKEKYIITQHQRYLLVAEAFLKKFENFPTNAELEPLFEQYNVSEITHREEKLNIINHSELLLIKNSYLGRMRVYKSGGHFYIYIQQLSYNVLLEDLKPKPYNFQIAVFIYTVFLLIFIALYFSLRKKLLPLKKLNDQIVRFSNGDLHVKITSVNNDEIGKIAQSFAQAIEFIDNQSKSKNLFMRNMMHELKTPITKGMIIAETLPNVRDKEILQNAFERMNNIIKELATVEKISSNILTIHKEKIHINDLYSATLKIMLLENVPITTKFENTTIEVDKELFAIALKNLLDNAIKFNTHEEAIINVNNKKIEVISNGEKLKNELDFYTEPFSQEEKRSDGFGLGLYIVKTILDLHGFGFSYSHLNKQNIFTITFKKATS